jgi:hypothetical protein
MALLYILGVLCFIKRFNGSVKLNSHFNIVHSVLVIQLAEMCDQLQHNVQLIYFKISFVKSNMFR